MPKNSALSSCDLSDKPGSMKISVWACCIWGVAIGAQVIWYYIPPAFFLLNNLYSNMPMPAKWTNSAMMNKLSWSSITNHIKNNACKSDTYCRSLLCCPAVTRKHALTSKPKLIVSRCGELIVRIGPSLVTPPIRHRALFTGSNKRRCGRVQPKFASR